MRTLTQIKTNFKLLLTGLLYCSISACDSKTGTITPEITDITESIYATGFIKSKNQYNVFAPANGVIEEIFVSEGSPIKLGDTIFKIESRSQEIATENAILATRTSDYTANLDKLLAAKKATEVARQTLSYDSLQYERQKKLWKQNIGSKTELEQKQLKLEQSEADLKRATTNFKDLKRQVQLASDQSKNNLKIAQLTQGNFIVKSEVDGVVYKLNKEEGELSNGQEPVAIIGTDKFVIELSIDEKDIVKVKEGQLVLIRMDSYDEQVFEARIIAIEPIMNTRTRSFQAQAVFNKKPAKLYPNLTVEANIIIQTKKNALTIPRKYLVSDSTVLLENGAIREIKAGLKDYETVEILSGIDKNTSIQLPSE
jgi:HlyD family secretion protein